MTVPCRQRYGRLACGVLPGEQHPRWFNEAITPKGSGIWDARWELGDRNRPDQKIWRVTYARAETDQLIPDARHLLAAVQSSWVFGGMGSWNNVGFEGADRYRALNEAVIVAANACSPSRGVSPIL